MFDNLEAGATTRVDLDDVTFEVTTAIRANTRLKVMWVQGLHWPRCCECDGTHVPIAFGEGLFGGTFKLAHRYFWEGTGIDLGYLEAAFNGWLRTGDLPDWTPGETGEDQ